jgi:DNA-binding NarL/FixJ family response regulator
MRIRALVIDDEPLARRTVRRFLKNHAEVEVVGESGDGVGRQPDSARES